MFDWPFPHKILPISFSHIQNYLRFLNLLVINTQWFKLCCGQETSLHQINYLCNQELFFLCTFPYRIFKRKMWSEFFLFAKFLWILTCSKTGLILYIGQIYLILAQFCEVIRGKLLCISAIIYVVNKLI